MCLGLTLSKSSCLGVNALRLDKKKSKSSEMTRRATVLSSLSHGYPHKRTQTRIHTGRQINRISFHTMCSQSFPFYRQQNTDREQIWKVRWAEGDGRCEGGCQEQGEDAELSLWIPFCLSFLQRQFLQNFADTGHFFKCYSTVGFGAWGAVS